VAVTDYDRFDGFLTLDLSAQGETCMGMGGHEIVTKEGEIVLRDESEIVCVLCQGADEKSRVEEDTKNVLFYAYAVPGIEEKHIRQGLDLAADIMVGFGQGTIMYLETFTP
jgi:DNA/RNA-binding domain of Phe-tRNA-synthetase-like protein